MTGPDIDLNDHLPEDPVTAEELDDEIFEDLAGEAEEPDAELQRVIEEREEFRNLYMRSVAEFQTFRRRAMEERDQARRSATENFALQILPALDNFERTLAAAESGASMESLLEGVQMIHRQLVQALGAVQIERIQSAGQPFDPELHEALAMDESGEAASGTVTAEIEPGYRMGGRVIRPARVRVAK